MTGDQYFRELLRRLSNCPAKMRTLPEMLGHCPAELASTTSHQPHPRAPGLLDSWTPGLQRTPGLLATGLVGFLPQCMHHTQQLLQSLQTLQGPEHLSLPLPWLEAKTLPAEGDPAPAFASASLSANARAETPAGGKAWAQRHRTFTTSPGILADSQNLAC